MILILLPYDPNIDLFLFDFYLNIEFFGSLICHYFQPGFSDHCLLNDFFPSFC